MDDVLGSGDGSVGNQSFVLHRPPLTIFPAADGSGVARALQIRVRGNLPNEPAAAADALLRRQSPGNERAYVVWRETDSLILEDATARAYTAREDENGVTTIEFGDGVHDGVCPRDPRMSRLHIVAVAVRTETWMPGTLRSCAAVRRCSQHPQSDSVKRRCLG